MDYLWKHYAVHALVHIKNTRKDHITSTFEIGKISKSPGGECPQIPPPACCVPMLHVYTFAPLHLEMSQFAPPPGHIFCMQP